MNEAKKSFKKLVEELAELDSMNEKAVAEWAIRCDYSYQREGISYKELELLSKLANKIGAAVK